MIPRSQTERGGSNRKHYARWKSLAAEFSAWHDQQLFLTRVSVQ